MPNSINYLIAQGRPAPTYDILDTQQKALNVLSSQREAQTYGEDRNWLRKQRGMLETKFSQEQDDRLRELQKRPFKDHLEALSVMVEEGPMISFESYPASREWFIKHGVRPEALPPPESFRSPEEFEAWKSQQLPMAKRQLEQMKAQTELIKATKPDLSEKGKTSRDYEAEVKTQAQKRVEQMKAQGIDVPIEEAANLVKGDIEKKYYPEKADTPSELGKLIKEYNALPEGSPDKQFYLATIKKKSESTGMRLRVNPDGSVEMIQGPMGASGELTRPMQTKVQEKLFNSTEQMARLREIETSFKPEYQEWGTRISNAWTSVKAKAGKNISTDDTQKLREFSQYKRKALENINQYIKEITGAQMSIQEADRIKKAMPDPGEGILDGDDPISFKGKLDDVVKQTKLSIIRYKMLMDQGMTSELIKKLAESNNLPELDKAKEYINQKGMEYEIKFRQQNPGISPNELKLFVAQELNKEFGL